jgi:curli biogenesis system outer membrane secretion channel CsgG
MRNMNIKLKAFVTGGLVAALAVGQAPPPAQTPPPAKPAAAKPAAPAAAKPAAVASPVDNVISLVKSGMSEGLIIKTLQKQNKPVNLTPADLVKLQNAKVSENIIGVMMDPASAPAPAAAPPPAASAPAPVASAPPPAVIPVSNPVSNPAPVSGPTTQAQKKRVIVDPFDYSTVTTAVQSVFGTNQNIGKGIQAMLVKRLGEQGKVVIVERGKIKELEAEQDRNAGNRVKQGAGARVGRISGADALLAGDIVIFGRDDKKKQVKGGGLIGGIGGAVANMNKEDKAVVAIDYRLIDAETSEIIATGEAKGESVRKSKGFAGIAGALGKGVAGVEVDMTSSNFAETIIGEATMDCVNKLADILNQQATDMKKTVREVEAYVADVAGRNITISAGGNDGVNVGEVFEILKIVREVKDPVTKEVLDRITDKVGELTISSVRDKIATGTYIGSAAAVGYIARKKM